jgi:5-formyltetrahydrofolate cyclo-ligase
MNKREMRAAMAAVLQGIDASDLAARSVRAARRLAATEAWARADTVLTFLSMPHELETSAVIAAARDAGKRVAVPRIEGGDLRFLVLPMDAGDLPRDRWDIPEPDPSWQALDLASAARVLVAAPGLAFDRQGNRLGRGRGYYDRFLAVARAALKSITVIGMCLSEQLVESVPRDDHDQVLDAVVTEAETIVPAS